MATGSQILSYQGNAGLAAGTAGGDGGMELYGATGVKDPGADINSSLKHMWDTQTEWNALKYAQAIRDRNELYSIFANNRIDFPIDDGDRPAVQAQIDKIKNMMTANPNMNDQANQQAIRAEFNTLEALKANAKSRNGDMITLRKQEAEELNPEMRELIKKHREEQASGGIEKQVLPFQKPLSWDPKTLYVQPDMVPITERRDFDPDHPDSGPQKMVTTRPDPTSYEKGWGATAMEKGPKNNRPFEVDDWYKGVIQNPKFRDPKYVSDVNVQVHAINQKTGKTPGQAGYLWPIGELGMETDENGNPTGNYVVDHLNGSPAQLGKTLNAIETWKETGGVWESDTELIDARKKLADTEKVKVDTEGATKDNEWKVEDRKRDQENSDEDLREKKIKNKKAERELAVQEEKAKSIVGKIKGIYGKNEFPAEFTPYDKNNAAQKNMYEQYLAPLGVTTDWGFMKIPKSKAAMEILGDPLVRTDPTTGKETTDINLPEQIYLMQSPSGAAEQALLVGVYRGANGGYYSKGFTKHGAGERIIAAMMKYNTGGIDYANEVGTYNLLAKDLLKGVGVIAGDEEEPEADDQQQKDPAIGPKPANAEEATINGETRWLIGNQMINPVSKDTTDLTPEQVAKFKQVAAQQAAGK